MTETNKILPEFSWINEVDLDKLDTDPKLLVRRKNGLRQTPGSILSIARPPNEEILIEAFNQLHKPSSKSQLTVGARAFSKHVHRDKTSDFWGTFGSMERCNERAKNETANEILMYFLNKENKVWQNVHGLPPFDSYLNFTYEIRVPKGYGMRWSYLSEDGTIMKFRGFLEPPCEDGHSKGWVH